MNLVEFARKKLLNGNFLDESELTQVEYELITAKNTPAKSILNLCDAKFGTHYGNIPTDSLDSGPYFPDIVAEIPDYLESEIEEDGNLPETPTNVLTNPILCSLSSS